MRMPLAVLAVCCATVCAAPPTARLDFTSKQKAELLDAHNAWRARVGTARLRWSAELERMSARWADRLASRGCRMQINDVAGIGQNIFYASALVSDGRRQLNPVTPTFVVDAWAAESADYSYQDNTCRPGRICGHYTQVVWDTTEEVGCAWAICPDLGQIWVCDYRPSGNIEGRRPY